MARTKQAARKSYGRPTTKQLERIRAQARAAREREARRARGEDVTESSEDVEPSEAIEGSGAEQSPSEEAGAEEIGGEAAGAQEPGPQQAAPPTGAARDAAALEVPPPPAGLPQLMLLASGQPQRSPQGEAAAAADAPPAPTAPVEREQGDLQAASEAQQQQAQQAVVKREHDATPPAQPQQAVVKREPVEEPPPVQPQQAAAVKQEPADEPQQEQQQEVAKEPSEEHAAGQQQQPPEHPTIKLEAVAAGTRQYYDLAHKVFDPQELKSLRNKFMDGRMPRGDRRNPTRHADKGSRGLPLAYKEHGEGFWALLSQVADRADQEQKEQQQQEAGEASTSGGAGPSSATPLQQQPPPLPWSGAVQGLPQLSAAAQLLWWLRCMELHWATCHHMPTVLGTRAGAADAEVVEILDLTADDEKKDEEEELADVAEWLESNGGWAITSYKEGHDLPPPSKRIKQEPAA